MCSDLTKLATNSFIITGSNLVCPLQRFRSDYSGTYIWKLLKTRLPKPFHRKIKGNLPYIWRINIPIQILSNKHMVQFQHMLVLVMVQIGQCWSFLWINKSGHHRAIIDFSSTGFAWGAYLLAASTESPPSIRLQAFVLKHPVRTSLALGSPAPSHPPGAHLSSNLNSSSTKAVS